MKIILYDQPQVVGQLLPFTYTRPVGEIRVGILKISEKWEHYLGASVGWYTQPHLRAKYPYQESSDYLIINGCFCPNEQLVSVVQEMKSGQALYAQDRWVAIRTA